MLPTISLPTRVTSSSQTLIDNILITPSKFEVVSGNLSVGISDHFPQFLILNTPIPSKVEFSNSHYRDWNNFDQGKFTQDFQNYDWKGKLELDKEDPDTSFDIFFDKISSLVDQHAPMKKLTKRQLKCTNKPWLTRGIKKSIYHRDKLKNLIYKTNDPELKTHYEQQYKIHRNHIVNIIRISKNQYYRQYFTNNLHNSKMTWKGINEIIKSNINKKDSSISLNINNTVVSDPQIVADKFNKHFTSIAGKIRKTIPDVPKTFKSYLNNSPANSLFFSPISNSETMKIINSLDIKKSTGPISIPNRILNTVLVDISKILTDIFNVSLKTGKFLKRLKTVKVVPVFKNKGSPLDVNNYRPISLLSNIDKIFEKLVHSRLTSFLNDNNILFNKQFGFRSKHSTTHILISLTEQIREALDKGKFSCGVFIDLQKAFDTVDHEILLQKLKHYGIRGTANNWFRSYLSNRKQFVSLSGHSSILEFILHGVPQGSVLGPLLFLIYINDIPNAVSFSNPLLFADDTALLYSDSNPKYIESRVNLDLHRLLNWLHANKIALNATKTEVIIFRNPKKQLNYDIRLKLNGKYISPSSHVKYLGILLDEHLSWNFHLNSLATKLRKTNGIISKLRHFVPRSTMRSIYFALFHSHISYASIVWGQNISNTSRIFLLQKAAIRLLTFSNFDAHTKPLFSLVSILTLPDLIFLFNTILIHDTLNFKSPSAIQDTLNLSQLPGRHATRRQNAKALTIPSVRTSKHGLNSIRYRTITNWNSLLMHFKDTDLSSTSIAQFKSLITKFLLNHYIN